MFSTNNTVIVFTILLVQNNPMDFFFRRRRTKFLYKLIFKIHPDALIWEEDDDVSNPDEQVLLTKVETEVLNFVTILNSDTNETFEIHCKVK